MATLLRFSEAAALALHAMGHLAVRAHECAPHPGASRPRGPSRASSRPPARASATSEVTSAKTLAALCGASDAHMVKVCQRLARRGLLEPHRGVGGGFALAKSAARIRLLDVYVAIEGPVKLRPCLFRDRTCPGHDGHECVFGRKVLAFETEFLAYLKDTTLASIAEDCSRRAPK